MNASGETRKGFPLTLPLPCDMRGCEQQNLWVITKRNTIRQDGVSFWNAAGRVELAASTGAKRVKSRGKGRAPANGSAIRGMPGSEFEPRLFCCAKVVACGRVIEREWGNPSKVPPSHSPFLAVGGSADNKTCGQSQKRKKHHPSGWCFFLECRGQGGTRRLDLREARRTVP